MAKEIVISPSSPWWQMDLKELWEFRELLYVFAWRDIKIKYKQTLLGIVWVLFQPLVTAGIFSIFFGKIANIPSGDLPYPLFVLIGMVIWIFFSSGLTSSSQSLITNEGIIKKVYIPRIILPLSAIITTGVDFLISSVMVVVFLLISGYAPPTSSIIIFPLLVLILVQTILGIGLLTSAINVKYRDVRYILPFFIQLSLFFSPILYPADVIYDYRKWFLIINPMTAVVENTRRLVTNSPLNWQEIGIGFLVSIILVVLGLFVFRKVENTVVDIV